MRVIGRTSLMLLAVIAMSLVIFGGRSFGQSSGGPGQADLDPLRRFIPRDDIFMPVPGGVSALASPPAHAETIEDQATQMHGGLIIGYCLRASCRYVSHLVVLQVCNNLLGGPDGTDYLTLAVVRLPFGKTPGFLKSLQGRDYAYNFETYGPFEQNLPIDSTDKVEALYALAADGAGPIAPLDYLGQTPKQPQSPETLALHMTIYQNDTGTLYPYFQVRHLCQQPVS